MSGVVHACHGKIPIVITSLDPAHSFSGKYETTVVNAHGCGVILAERLEKETPVVVELISNGRSKKGRIVLTISVVEGVSWLLGLEFDTPSGIFWEIENPPADGGSKGGGNSSPKPRPRQTVVFSAGRSNHLISVTSPFGFHNNNNSAGEMRSFRCMFQCNPTRGPLRPTSKSLEGSKFSAGLGQNSTRI
jgi:hypothetical protein